MKILIVTPYRSYAGGVESYNSMIESILVDEGHEVEYLTTEGELSQSVEFKSKIYGKAYITASKFKEIDSEKYDLIICNGEFSMGIHHRNVINIFHGSFKGVRDFTKSQISYKDYLSLTWQAYLQVRDTKDKLIVTVSEFNANQLASQGVKVDKILLNPIYTKRFKSSGQAKKGVLNISTYNEYVKGFDLLEKLSLIRDDITCCTNVSPRFNCKWIKSTQTVDVVELYNTHEITLIPSRFESASLVALESMSCGTPILMNRVGYALEIEKEIPEFVLDQKALNDPQLYNERIELILNDYDRLSKLATEYVRKNHCINVFKDNFLKLIN